MKYLFLLLMASSAFASEHEPSIKDLIPYIFNFSIVFIPLLWFVKKKATVSFANYSENIVKITNDAKELEAEAKEKAERVDYLVNNFEKVIAEEKQKYDDEFASYSQGLDTYVEEQTKKLTEDYDNRFEYEKELTNKKFNQVVVDEIICKAKQAIVDDPTIQKEIVKKIMDKID